MTEDSCPRVSSSESDSSSVTKQRSVVLIFAVDRIDLFLFSNFKTYCIVFRCGDRACGLKSLMHLE